MDNKHCKSTDPMYIKIRAYGDTATWESSQHDADLSDMLSRFKGLLITIGFNELTVNQCIIDMADEIKEEKALENEQEEEVF